VAEQTSGARPPVFYPGYERMWRVLRTVGCRCSCTGKDAQARAIAELLDGVNPWSLRPGRQVWGDAHATSPNGIDTFYDSTVEQFALQPLEVLSLRQVCLVRGMRQHFVMYINAHLPPVVVQHQQTLYARRCSSSERARRMTGRGCLRAPGMRSARCARPCTNAGNGDRHVMRPGLAIKSTHTFAPRNMVTSVLCESVARQASARLARLDLRSPCAATQAPSQAAHGPAVPAAHLREEPAHQARV
jgi:hypothetical protein